MTFFFLFFLIIFLIIFIWYLSYRISVLFLLNKTHVHRMKKTILKKNWMKLSDGYIVNSLLYTGKSNILFITLHGMGSNYTEFITFATHAQKNGHSVLIWTQRNAGMNQADSSYHVRTLVDDIYDVHQLCQREFPNKRLVLVGHSLGAMILGKLLGDYPKINPNTRFCLINPATKYFFQIDSFARINSFLSWKLFKGLFFNKNSIFWVKQSSQAISNFSQSNEQKDIIYMKKIVPFYFITNSYILISNSLKALQKNKINPVLMIFGGLDQLQSHNRIHFLAHKFFKTNKNIQINWHPKLKHLFPKKPPKSIKFNEEIIKFGTQPKISKFVSKKNSQLNKNHLPDNFSIISLED